MPARLNIKRMPLALMGFDKPEYCPFTGKGQTKKVYL